MLSSIKELLNTNLLQSVTTSTGIKNRATGVPNYYAGADILAKYQDKWEELHKLSETNAIKAEQLAAIITQVQLRQKSDNVALTAITNALEAPAKLKVQNDADADGAVILEEKSPVKGSSLISGLQVAIVSLKKLQIDMENVETALVHLENIIEQAELEKRKKDHMIQFRLYEELKMDELQEYRKELANKHAKSMLDQDMKEKLKLQERQEVFQDAFKTDLETYKTLGTIPKIQSGISNKPSAMLEEIQLDADTQDLEDFLKD